MCCAASVILLYFVSNERIHTVERWFAIESSKQSPDFCLLYLQHQREFNRAQFWKVMVKSLCSYISKYIVWCCITLYSVLLSYIRKYCIALCYMISCVMDLVLYCISLVTFHHHRPVRMVGFYCITLCHILCYIISYCIMSCGIWC